LFVARSWKDRKGEPSLEHLTLKIIERVKKIVRKTLKPRSEGHLIGRPDILLKDFPLIRKLLLDELGFVVHDSISEISHSSFT